ncbi:hypothetical protein D0C36_22685 [Mucilaginibacter conchicola]|uniref:Uncharacterized protein n=1 Tax=Mucilaginibacter conchicola TaxID=2303333 RepID=A0A372NM88_9SPHI|nr:hypothetical protein [Mucilaginibacter conchicola]RFZ90054.1 hypothetical protein D0C36_22685 [Mucilaginibacter conchicola]
MESIEQINRTAGSLRKKSKALLSYTLLTLAATIAFSNAEAQTFSEWFFQGSTQKKYLLQQIAALQVYSGYLSKGYRIANGGLGYIGKELRKEFSEHRVFYDKLRTVNPSFRNDPRFQEIIEWQQSIIRLTGEIRKVRSPGSEERYYLARVCNALLRDCESQISALEQVMIDGRTQMDDEERMSRIQIIHQRMESNYLFASTLNAQVCQLNLQRETAAKDIRFQRKINSSY